MNEYMGHDIADAGPQAGADGRVRARRARATRAPRARTRVLAHTHASATHREVRTFVALRYPEAT